MRIAMKYKIPELRLLDCLSFKCMLLPKSFVVTSTRESQMRAISDKKYPSDT